MINILLTLVLISSQSIFAKNLKVSETFIKQHLNGLSKIGNLGLRLEDGFTRNAWSDEETKAFEYIKNEGVKIGLIPRFDAVGNLFLRTTNNANITILTGSHLDTVPAGGNFDGAVGVIAGLEAIRAIKEKGFDNKVDLELVVWRGEESTSYGVAHKGSKLAFNDKFIIDDDLEKAIKQQGFTNPTSKTVIPNPSAYFEVHIEQSNKLEADNKEIGIVTSIRGADRYKIEVFGKFDHSGATPMGTKYRSDANLAIAYMQVNLDTLLNKYIDDGYDLVQTIGIVNSDEKTNEKNKLIYNNSQTKVSGYGYFILDIRSNNKEQRLNYIKNALIILETVSKKFNTKIKLTHISESDTAEYLDYKLQNKIKLAVESLNYTYEFLPSGAGHDAAVLAKHLIPTAMIFIPCKNGISHSKEEFAKISDIRKGTEVLAAAMLDTIKDHVTKK